VNVQIQEDSSWNSLTMYIELGNSCDLIQLFRDGRGVKSHKTWT